MNTGGLERPRNIARCKRGGGEKITTSTTMTMRKSGEREPRWISRLAGGCRDDRFGRKLKKKKSLWKERNRQTALGTRRNIWLFPAINVKRRENGVRVRISN